VADLQSGDEKIVDIAAKYGYASPTAFNRAFQSVHGIAPSLVKENGATLKSFPPISFKIMVQGVEEMSFRIEKKPAFRIVGVSEPLQNDIEKNFEAVLLCLMLRPPRNRLAENGKRIVCCPYDPFARCLTTKT